MWGKHTHFSVSCNKFCKILFISVLGVFFLLLLFTLCLKTSQTATLILGRVVWSGTPQKQFHKMERGVYILTPVLFDTPFLN